MIKLSNYKNTDETEKFSGNELYSFLGSCFHKSPLIFSFPLKFKIFTFSLGAFKSSS